MQSFHGFCSISTLCLMSCVQPCCSPLYVCSKCMVECLVVVYLGKSCRDIVSEVSKKCLNVIKMSRSGLGGLEVVAEKIGPLVDWWKIPGLLVHWVCKKNQWRLKIESQDSGCVESRLKMAAEKPWREKLEKQKNECEENKKWVWRFYK